MIPSRPYGSTIITRKVKRGRNGSARAEVDLLGEDVISKEEYVFSLLFLILRGYLVFSFLLIFFCFVFHLFSS